MNARDHILIVGLGATGASVIRYLSRRSQKLCATDALRKPPNSDSLRVLYPGVDYRLGGLAAGQPLSKYSMAVLSPGVSIEDPFVAKLRTAGVEVIGDVELFARHLATTGNAPVAAITGSNGKSTVTALVGEMARRAGIRVAVGGNFGPPALDLLAKNAELYVLELSSFQLEMTRSLSPAVSVWLNISADHLDRHGTLESYAAAKARIFEGASQAIVNRDDAIVMRYAPLGAISFGLNAPEPGDYGVQMHDGEPWLVLAGHPLVSCRNVPMVGRHNVANALAALAAASAIGITAKDAVSALRAFNGLPHRCERVSSDDGIVWINDSKGTNVGAALAALESFPGPIVWLGGGRGKSQDFAPLRAPLAQKGRCAFVFGEEAPQLVEILEGTLPVESVPTLEAAVAGARARSRRGDQVLLSPACSSLDQFSNYRERGDRFRSLIHECAT